MNFGEIKTAIINRTHRSDLASHVAEFVALAESEYNARTDSSYDLAAGTDSTHNTLSDLYPTVYIYGGLMQYAIWANDDAAIQKYTALFERGLAQAQYGEAVESGVFEERMETDVPTDYTFDITTGGF